MNLICKKWAYRGLQEMLGADVCQRMVPMITNDGWLEEVLRNMGATMHTGVPKGKHAQTLTDAEDLYLVVDNDNEMSWEAHAQHADRIYILAGMVIVYTAGEMEIPSPGRHLSPSEDSFTPSAAEVRFPLQKRELYEGDLMTIEPGVMHAHSGQAIMVFQKERRSFGVTV